MTEEHKKEPDALGKQRSTELRFHLPSPPSSSSDDNTSGSGRCSPSTPPDNNYDYGVSGGGEGQGNVSSSMMCASRALRRLRSASASKSEDHVLRTGRRVVYTAGRPPWYDTHGQLKEPFIIGICGGSASGKTTVAQKIIEALDIPWVTLLSMDSFYNILNEEQHERAKRNEYNFDHPDAFDLDLLYETLRKLRDGKKVEVPVYNFSTHSREKTTKTMYGADVLIFEGIMAFTRQDMRDIMDVKIFVDTDADIRLSRRLERDICERGRDLEGVIKQYTKFVKPAFDNFIAPTMRFADIIIPRGGENKVAINLIVQYIQKKLTERGFDRNRSCLLSQSHSGQPLPQSLYLLPETPQIRGIHTIIRNRECDRHDFIFYSRRLMRGLIEYGLSLLPFKSVTVEMPSGNNNSYEGRVHAWEFICGVSILRAGEAMEPALREIVKDCQMGKILIQTNCSTNEPELYYLRLPRDIQNYHVLLMDATVATGASAMMAIRILLDHDVKEEKILLLSLLMAETGVHSIAYAFPKVRMVTTAVDPSINHKYYILPGIGNFGDRYFGTYADCGVDSDGRQLDEDIAEALKSANFELAPSSDEEE